MNCPKCQKPLPSGAKNCTACKTALSVPDFFANLDKTKKIGIVIGIIFLLMLLLSITRDNNINSDNYRQGTRSSNTQEGWYTYTDPNGNFSATFPYAPTKNTSTIPVQGTNSSIAIEALSSSLPSGTTYYLNISQYPADLDLSNPKEILQNSLDGALNANASQQLISSSFGTFSGSVSLDFLVKNDATIPGSTVYLRGKSILIDHTLYQLMAIYEATSANEANYDAFINSFVITK